VNLLLAIPVVLPLLAAAVCVALRDRAGIQAAVAAGVAAAVGVVGMLLLFAVGSGVAASNMGAWPVPMGIALVADGLSAALVAVAGLVVLVAVAYRRVSLRETGDRSIFHPLLMALLAGVRRSMYCRTDW